MGENKKDVLLQATAKANHALIMALIDRVSENNVEIFNEIMSRAANYASAKRDDDPTGEASGIAKCIIETMHADGVRRMTPNSQLSPGSFQRQIIG